MLRRLICKRILKPLKHMHWRTQTYTSVFCNVSTASALLLVLLVLLVLLGLLVLLVPQVIHNYKYDCYSILSWSHSLTFSDFLEPS